MNEVNLQENDKTFNDFIRNKKTFNDFRRKRRRRYAMSSLSEVP